MQRSVSGQTVPGKSSNLLSQKRIWFDYNLPETAAEGKHNIVLV